MKIKTYSGETLFEDDSRSLKTSLENAVKSKSNLYNADLRSADLSGADLRGAKGLGTFLWSLQEAIKLAPIIFSSWEKTSLRETADEYKGITPDGEAGRALVKIHRSLDGGFCYVLSRREIWWWNWHCPNPNTVLVLWRENELLKEN